MRALIQRVSKADVTISGECVGKINKGILLLLGVEKKDDSELAQALLDKIVSYRIFEDDAGKMNRSLKDIEGELLVVSQFTLAADTKKGRRPSFSNAAPPEKAQRLYEEFILKARETGLLIQSGRFAADMAVTLVNDGPVTFLLEV